MQKPWALKNSRQSTVDSRQLAVDSWQSAVGSRQSEGGFTLIELMISLMVLCVGILAIWSMQGAAIRGNSTARKITQSATLGADQFEKLMVIPYDDAALMPGTTTSRTDGIYTVAWVVSPIDTPISNVKTVTVTASWIEAGQQRSVRYVYYKADKI